MKGKGLEFFQKITMYFLKKGKRSTIETNVRFFLKNNLKKKKAILLKQSEKSMHNLTPYVRLLSRKKGKRTKYKVRLIEKKEREKKAYLSVVKVLRDNKTGYFLNMLHKEISTIALKKSSFNLKRDSVHKTAYYNIPYSWSKKRRQARKNALRKNYWHTVDLKKEKLKEINAKFATRFAYKKKKKRFKKVIKLKLKKQKLL